VAEWQRKEHLVRAEIEATKREKVEATRRLTENAKRFAEELKVDFAFLFVAHLFSSNNSHFLSSLHAKNQAHRNEISVLLKDRAKLASSASELSMRSERDAKLLAQKSEQVAVSLGFSLIETFYFISKVPLLPNIGLTLLGC